MKSVMRVLMAFLLALLMAPIALSQAKPAAKPSAQAPANQGNQPTPPGPAQRTAQATAPAKTQAEPWKQIPIPKLPEFHPAIPKQVKLKNGMVVFLQEDHELPLITAVARIRGGSRVEPANKIGLVDIYGEVWRTGGTKTKTGDQMDDLLEMRAAKIETDGGTDSTTISLNCLKADFDDVFALFQELLRDPAFREDKIALAKTEMNTAIARRNDDIGSIAAREAAFLAYGKDNPYARVPEYATVAAVNHDDLVKWHDEYVHPNNILFGIVGDFDSAAMEKKLRDAFESWAPGPAAPKPEIKFTPAKPGYYYANKEDVNQSAVRMVALGIERSNPDYFAVEVMNEVFGGGFSSRLFKNIRTRLGLAYNVGGGIGAAYDHPGISRISTGTKSASTADVIKAVDEQILDLLKNPTTQAELQRAKDSILNSFIFNIDTPDKVLRERMAYEWYGYPLDFLERFRAGVEKVTTADVDRVAHKYIHPGMFAILVVGNTEADKLLTGLGPVSKLDISIPPPGGAENAQGQKPAARPTISNVEGKALMAKVVQAMGGAAKLDAIKSFRVKATVVQKTPQGEMPLQMENTVVFPDRAIQLVQTPMGEMKSVLSPTAAFMSMGGQVRDLPPSMKESSLEDIKRDELYIAQHVNDPKFVFAADGTEKIGAVEAVALDIAGDGITTRWYVDPATGHIVQTVSDSVGMRGPTHRVSTNTAWANFQGLTLPSQSTIAENGQETTTIKIDDVQINPPIDEKQFQKPAAAAAAPGSNSQ